MSPHARNAVRERLNAYERSCWFTGLSWTVVPSLTASTTEQQAQLDAVVRTASSQVDTFCRQPLRATVNTEVITGPGRGRLTVDPDSGIATVVCRRWPVTEVLAVQTSPARSFPPSWTPVDGDQWSVRYPVLPGAGPSGGNIVDLAPRVVDWAHGRGWWRVQHSYVSGWAHAGLTAQATAGTSTVEVDDVTGWAGASGFLYDGTSTEPVTCDTVVAGVGVALPNGAGIVEAGPGTLTLTIPLVYGHGAGAVITALPETVLRGAALFAAVQAIETIDAIATQAVSGETANTGMLAKAAEDTLCSFVRVI